MTWAFHGHGYNYVGYFRYKEAPDKYTPEAHDTWMGRVRAHLFDGQRLPELASWYGFPLVVRLRLTSTQTRSSHVSTWPVVLLGQAPVESSSASPSFVLLDLTGKTATMTFVLRDWSKLVLKHDALEAFGLSAAGLRRVDPERLLTPVQRQCRLVARCRRRGDR